MTTQARSLGELYEVYRNEAEAQAPELTDWSEGSINDLLAGLSALAVSEAQKLLVDLFRRTMISTADGPEVTEGPDYLEELATDHFGTSFARLAAQKATGTVTFSRATTGAGTGTIPAGTIVKTPIDVNGQSQQFETLLDVTMSGLTVNASVEAITAGTAGNVAAEAVTEIQTALFDNTITVENAAAFSGGAAKQDDATYREYIYNLILTLGKATPAAIRAAALNVTGVENATVVETVLPVREWDIANETDTGSTFYLIRTKLYIADANGTADAALLAEVEEAVESIRAAGVSIEVLAATAVEMDWTASVSLNVSGPNYAALSADLTPIEVSMASYINDLATGDDFVRATARLAILAIWGPSGTNDITAFTNSVPSGDVSTAANEKLVPGTMTLS